MMLEFLIVKKNIDKMEKCLQCKIDICIIVDCTGAEPSKSTTKIDSSNARTVVSLFSTPPSISPNKVPTGTVTDLPVFDKKGRNISM